MSINGDFFALITALWDVEQFDMWNPLEHSSLAYLLDRTYGQPGYRENYETWLALAKEKNFNEFAWVVSQAMVRACQEDERLSPEEKAKMKQVLEWQKTRYDTSRLSGFGFIHEKYVPDWFFELFGTYIPLERMKREITIVEYLTDECGMSPERANSAYQKLDTYKDILNEFYFYVKNRRFKTFSPLTVKGYSAKQLNETTYLSPLGAYNYLIYLRESPEEALRDLKNGLPKK